MSAPGRQAARRRRLLVGAAYWALVLAVSLALVVGLLLFLEARDAPQVPERGAPGGVPSATPG